MGVKFSQLPIIDSVASNDYIAILDTSETLLKRTPIAHASTANVYGLGNANDYGHTKVVDGLSSTAYSAGESLSAHQGNVLASDIGPNEYTNTATSAHAKDDCFMWKGQFVKSTAAIAVGDTIADGVNTTATNVSAILSELNSNLTACYEEATALYDHLTIGEILYIDDVFATTTAVINVSDTITDTGANANITYDNDIRVNDAVYIRNLPGSGGGSSPTQGTIIPSTNSVTLDYTHTTVQVPLTVQGDGALAAVSSDTDVATVSLVGTTLIVNSVNNTKGSAIITVTLASTPAYIGTSVNISVDATAFSIKKTFAVATDAEIVEMVTAADAGYIDLYDDCGWRVGQEHSITISAIAASGTYDGVSWTVGESHDAQTATLVLMNRGTGLSANQCNLINPVKNTTGQDRYTPSFVVGLKNCLITRGYINSSNTNAGSWNSCARRNWCNGGFRQAIPSNLRSLFKKFKTISAAEYNASTLTTSQDYFALAAEKEIFGGKTYCNDTEAANLTQFDYYKDSTTRIKKAGDEGSAVYWWERSPHYNDSSAFCSVYTNGNASYNAASYGYSLSPFGCI